MAGTATRLTGFRKIEAVKIPTRLIVSVEATEGCGKTIFGLGAASSGTVYLQRFDRASEGALKLAQDAGLDVRVKDYDLDVVKDEIGPDAKAINRTKDEAGTLFDEYQEDLKQIIAEGATPVIDTFTEAWELARLAEFGKVTQVQPHMYSRLNAKFRHLLNSIVLSPCSAVLIHKLKDVWENKETSNGLRSAKTGELERSGFSDIGYGAHVMVRLYRAGMRGDPNGEVPEPSREFMMRILKCNPKADLVGLDLEISDPLEGFNTLGQLIFEGEWEA